MTLNNFLKAFTSLIGLAVISLHAQAVALTQLEFTAQANGVTQLDLRFDGTAPTPAEFSLERPARIVLDFPATENRLPQKRYTIGTGNVRNAVVVSNGNRTRLVLSMTSLLPYSLDVSRRRIRMLIGQNVVPDQSSLVPSVIDTPAMNRVAYWDNRSAGFMPAEFSTTATSATETTVGADQDVGQDSAHLSLNFQDIEVRYALQQIADVVGLNLIASDSVQGNITLRLQDVPWDQALDMVLRSKGLAKRQSGSVLVVAPAQELADQEKLALESLQWEEKIAPLQTDFIQVNYANADDILRILHSGPNGKEDGAEQARLGFLSERGAVSIDARTNTLIVRDTVSNLDSIHRAVEHFDVPVRQVLIEARIVAARTSVGEQLGIRWGGNVNSGGSSPVVASGSLESTASIGSDLNTSDGASYEQIYPDALVVDLPVLSPNATSFAIGVAAFDYALDLELSALETRGSAEVVSQPRVVTSNGQEAFINSGQTIAFDGGDGGTTFVDAGLSLRVTPQITPDDHVVLDLLVTQDSLAAGGGAIDTNSVTTQVLVKDGETLVLGGVYRTETVTSVDKTPWLGDLPVLGRLFRRSSEFEEKTEMLVFITPSLMTQQLVSR
ncbi:type IV pilus secretin PilQ [Saccharospirillum mangrovi]|uniref:type IV pilus secretin PilQ n=1 Tax=Saccharospirillum mangrovi TaxID=2161747 RepID=UPI000D366554|nr:type IV pilus secretin PilQ [Saccharospirillum mangrovi]